MNILKQITVPLCDLICHCNVHSKTSASFLKGVCVMPVILLCRGAHLVASLSSLLEGMSGVVCYFLFVTFMFIPPHPISSCRRGNEQFVRICSWDCTCILVQNKGS